MKDFAKKNKLNKKSFIVTLLLNVLFITIIAAGIYYLYTKIQYNRVTKNTALHASNLTSKRSVKVNAHKNFDFYSILPTIAVPKRPQANEKNNEYNPALYYLQVSATRSHPGALKLQEKLGTEGYAAVVVHNNGSNSPTYRILVGPFKDLTNTKINKNLLKQNNITSFIVVPKMKTG